MRSVSLFLSAVAVLSDVAADMGADMERMGAHGAAQNLKKALSHDDPLAEKLRNFAAAVAHEVDTARRSGKGAAVWMKHEANLAELTGFAEMKDAAEAAGVFKRPRTADARPSSFSQTAASSALLDASPYDESLDATAEESIDLPSASSGLADMARMEQQDAEEASFDNSLNPASSFTQGVVAPDLLGAENYDYNGDVAPSLDSLTSELVTDAAQSDVEAHEAEMSLLQTKESPGDDRSLERQLDAEKDGVLDVEGQSAEMEILKAAKNRVMPVSSPITDPQVVAAAKQMGMAVPILTEAQAPISSEIVEEQAEEDQKEELSKSDEDDLAYRERDSARDMMMDKKIVEGLKAEERTHKRSLKTRVKESSELLLKSLAGSDELQSRDLGGQTLQDRVKEAFGGGAHPLRSTETPREGESMDAGEEESLVDVSPDGTIHNMRHQ